MIDIHVSGHNAKEILTELRVLLDGTASAPMHVCAHVTPEEPAPVAEPGVKPAEEPPKEPACTTEELRGVLNAVRVFIASNRRTSWFGRRWQRRKRKSSESALSGNIWRCAI